MARERQRQTMKVLLQGALETEMERDLDELLNVLNCPEAHRRKVRTTSGPSARSAGGPDR